MPRGIRKASRLEPADIVDIAPTVLHLQGLTVPADLDGRVLTDMLEEQV